MFHGFIVPFLPPFVHGKPAKDHSARKRNHAAGKLPLDSVLFDIVHLIQKVRLHHQKEQGQKQQDQKQQDQKPVSYTHLVYTAKQAKENGLIDEIGTLDDVVSDMKKDFELGDCDVQTISYQPTTSLLSILSGPVSYTHLDVYKRQT